MFSVPFAPLSYFYVLLSRTTWPLSSKAVTTFIDDSLRQCFPKYAPRTTSDQRATIWINNLCFAELLEHFSAPRSEKIWEPLPYVLVENFLVVDVAWTCQMSGYGPMKTKIWKQLFKWMILVFAGCNFTGHHSNAKGFISFNFYQPWSCWVRSSISTFGDLWYRTISTHISSRRVCLCSWLRVSFCVCVSLP